MSLGSASDLSFMFRDAGVAVLYNGTATFGIPEQMDVIESTDGGQVQVRAETLLIATDSLTDLRHDGVITVATRPYRIDRFGPEDDGDLTRIFLARRR